MEDRHVPLYKLILEIRSTYDDLKALSDAMNQDVGLSSASRDVVESLYGRDNRTVPEIAKAKSVSRQHIQLLVDGLVAKGLVEFHNNPSHKRSKLVILTASGRQLFDHIRSREAEKMATLSTKLDGEALTDAVRVLHDLRHMIAKT